jgi:hypothetical protein
MIAKTCLPLIVLLLICYSCKKSSDSIDTSKVYHTDFAGNPFTSDTLDGQWKRKNFDGKEMDLFSSLDTANAAGTAQPSYIGSGFAYPSPFISTFSVPLQMDSAFHGKVLVKFVIVNNTFTPLLKGAAIVQPTTYRGYILSLAQVAINPATIAVGKYRLYVTVSSQNNNHFYKTWGNIEKM